MTTGRGSDEDPPVLVFSAGAADRMEQFMERLEPDLGPGGSAEHMSGWAGKLAGGIARMAGVFHLASIPAAGVPADKPIEVDTLEAAIKLGDYFRGEATRAYGAYGTDLRILRARRILEWIQREGKTPFTDRDAQRGTSLKKEEIWQAQAL